MMYHGSAAYVAPVVKRTASFSVELFLYDVRCASICMRCFSPKLGESATCAATREKDRLDALGNRFRQAEIIFA
jgi:hypothetical protein